MPPETFRKLADSEGLSQAFPAAVTAEVARFVAEPGIDDAALVDLSKVPFVTIDGPLTRDLDQAVHVEKSAKGFRLLYAIADASYYVSPGTALWDEALRRGASFYLPTFSVPMLPRELSEGLVSLGPDVDRRALVFDVALDLAGSVVSFELVRARVRSRAKLAFEDVDALVLGDASSALRGQPYTPSLKAIADLGLLRTLHEDRKAMVRYRRAETEVHLDASGKIEVSRAPRTAIELANEQISILCNALGARFLLGGTADIVQPIYRVHAPPDPERVRAFEELVGLVAKERGLPDDPWVYRRAADLGLSGYLESLPTTGAPGRLARALHRQAMLLNGRSLFSGEASGHFGVGESVYSRFTAPMREIVGVQCHAQAVERMAGRPARPRDADLAIREQVIEAANKAKDTQRRLNRELDKLVVGTLLGSAAALPPDQRPLLQGTVVGFSTSKVHVLLDDPPIDVRVPLFEQGKTMKGAWLLIEGQGARLVRKEGGATVCRLGDTVTVRASTPESVVIVRVEGEPLGR